MVALYDNKQSVHKTMMLKQLARAFTAGVRTAAPQEPPQVVVVGGGVVGCAVARQLGRSGVSCRVLEQCPDLVSGASCGNSGIACTGYDAEPSSLEHACLRSSVKPLQEFLVATRIPHKRTGSLVIAWTSAGAARMPGEQHLVVVFTTST